MSVSTGPASPRDHHGDVGALLRRCRDRRGMSVVAAAEQAKMSPVTWGKIENGGNGADVKPESLIRAAEVLGIPGGTVVDAWLDPTLLPALENAVRGTRTRSGVDLSTVPDDDLAAELAHRLTTRRETIARFLASQGPPAD